MISYTEALGIINSHINDIKLKTEILPITESLGKTLAEDVIADIDFPNFDNSAMDGYAVRFNDKIREWTVIGEISAGNYQKVSIDDNSAVSIMTGAKLPIYADTVIPIENVTVDLNKIRLKDEILLKKGTDVRFKGEDLKKDTLAIKRDTLIRTNNISILAACGKSHVKVYSPLRIGIFSSGDELIDIDSIPRDDKIRSSNLHTLISLIKELKMEVINLGIIRDDKKLLYQTIQKALNNNIDILVTTGGVSVGKYDYLKDVIEETGFEHAFWKVKVKPGKPLLFSIYRMENRKILYFGLPGNPVSSFVSFNLFIKPFISQLYNYEKQKIITAKLDVELIKKDERTHFVRGIIEYDKKRQLHHVIKAGGQSSGDIATLSNANCLIIFDESKNKLTAGENVDCIMI